MAAKILHLTIKKKWFDMIASGEKKEEYRELNDYWHRRFSTEVIINAGTPTMSKHYNVHENYFEQVHFYNGWCFDNKFKNLKIKCEGIKIGTGKSEWGAELHKKYFVIKLGEILNHGS